MGVVCLSDRQPPERSIAKIRDLLWRRYASAQFGEEYSAEIIPFSTVRIVRHLQEALVVEPPADCRQ